MEFSKATILVVDDDETLREVLVDELNNNNFKTLTAANGIEALKIVRGTKVHLIISDVKMPGGDGVELLKKIREIDPFVPVLFFMSGFSHLSKEEAFAMGAKRLFEKPFNRKEFMDEVKNTVQDLKE